MTGKGTARITTKISAKISDEISGEISDETASPVDGAGTAPVAPSLTRIDPIRPTDDSARALARDLLRTAPFGSLATLGPDGAPLCSLISLGMLACGTPLIAISRLSGHTTNLLANPRASLLLSRIGRGDPLAHPRISIAVTARVLDRDSEAGRTARRRFLSRQPKAELYIDFPDFLLVALDITGASLNGGFGKAYELSAADLCMSLDGAEALLAAESSAIDHMNADHADAIRLYATALGGQVDGAWRLAGIDPEGLDLALGQTLARIDFPRRVTTPDDLRRVLVDLAAQARDTADHAKDRT